VEIASDNRGRCASQSASVRLPSDHRPNARAAALEHSGERSKCSLLDGIGPYTPFDRVSGMHLIRPNCPPVNPLPRSGENLLLDKKTGEKRYPVAPAGSLLLTSAPFGWRGIIVERHRLPPAEMPEHSVIGTASLSTSVRSQLRSRGRKVATDGMISRPTLVTAAY
jgi:hypothetical protein